MSFRFISALVMILSLLLGLASAVWAQAGRGAGGPAAVEINRTFAFSDKWAMYGAPQEARLTEEGFNQLVARIGRTRFAANQVQIVVIMRGADASGTIGLIEKRGKRLESFFVKVGDQDIYGIWHKIGYRTSPDRISADFRENVLSAEEAYRDLPITFNGTVRTVAKDERGEIYVDFLIKGRDAGLRCYPWQGAPQGLDIRDMKAGGKVQTSGQFTSFSEDGTIKLRGCLFSRN